MFKNIPVRNGGGGSDGQGLLRNAGGRTKCMVEVWLREGMVWVWLREGEESYFCHFGAYVVIE